MRITLPQLYGSSTHDAGVGVGHSIEQYQSLPVKFTIQTARVSIILPQPAQLLGTGNGNGNRNGNGNGNSNDADAGSSSTTLYLSEAEIITNVPRVSFLVQVDGIDIPTGGVTCIRIYEGCAGSSTGSAPSTAAGRHTASDSCVLGRQLQHQCTSKKPTETVLGVRAAASANASRAAAAASSGRNDIMGKAKVVINAVRFSLSPLPHGCSVVTAVVASHGSVREVIAESEVGIRVHVFPGYDAATLEELVAETNDPDECLPGAGDDHYGSHSAHRGWGVGLGGLRLGSWRHGSAMLYHLNDVYIGRSLHLLGEWSQRETDLFSVLLRHGGYCAVAVMGSGGSSGSMAVGGDSR